MDIAILQGKNHWLKNVYIAEKRTVNILENKQYMQIKIEGIKSPPFYRRIKMLEDIKEGKILPRAYGHISHLPVSKMRDYDDTLLGETEISLLTVGREWLS